MVDRSVIRNAIAFWLLGLLNNVLYTVMNAGAHNINSAGIGLVYLANVAPSLLMKATGPYWFDYISYKGRIWACAVMMVLCLLIVAWAESAAVKLIGVMFASTYGGIGEASMLGMAAFYDKKKVLTAWSSGTGFAGIAGYLWSILFDNMNVCFQVEMMLGLWIPVVWLVTFHVILEPPWIDSVRANELGDVSSTGDDDSGSSDSDDESESAAGAQAREMASEHKAERPVTQMLSCGERFRYILTLWPYMIPLVVVFAAEYTIQAGFWAAMGFPITDRASRRDWYKYANLSYQVGVFISRSTFVLVCKKRAILWAGAIMQLLMVFFFWSAAATPWGNWWLLVPSLFVGLMGGGVYVGAFCLITQEQPPEYIELALSSASLGDSFGILIADVLGIIVQGCMFGRMGVEDVKPDFTCGYDIWEALNASAAHAAANASPDSSRLCFPGVPPR